ncbi:MAG: 50S ribosomal protein L33 [Armatimonadetes bacterium]|nr:50S ribosomal protein L33 [Armatimonadota bacterium]MDW8122353.1 50S ribosomal protein L33 [Armatimonadota bacterium]
MRTVIRLECSECKSRNYTTTKKREQGGPQKRLELRKYCRRCRKHTVHREGR